MSSASIADNDHSNDTLARVGERDQKNAHAKDAALDAWNTGTIDGAQVAAFWSSLSAMPDAVRANLTNLYIGTIMRDAASRCER